jgi:hypothetical protein
MEADLYFHRHSYVTCAHDTTISEKEEEGGGGGEGEQEGEKEEEQEEESGLETIAGQLYCIK